MKLYHTDDDVWHGTQAEAKKHAREHNTDYEQRDVPTDKPGLIEYLNRIKEPPPVSAIQMVPVYGHQPDEIEQAELRAVAAAASTTMSQHKQLTADSIVSFILDDATVAQTETIFAAIGTRFKEHINAP